MASILGQYYSATPKQRENGRNWYKLAHLVATEYALRYHTSVSAAAGVIAALSPMKSWSQNLKLAADCLAGGVPRHMGANARLACAIRDGAEPDVALRGRKTAAFWRAIMGDENAVVIDRWMIRALGLPDSTRLTPNQYDTLAAIVTSEAAIADATPAQFQAVVWCAIRGRSF